MLKQANLNKLIIAALVSVMILSGCAAPTATAVPATAAPAATVAPAATTAPTTAHRQPLPPQAPSPLKCGPITETQVLLPHV